MFARLMMVTALVGAIFASGCSCLVRNVAVQKNMQVVTCRLDAYTKTDPTFTDEDRALRLQTYEEARALVKAEGCQEVLP